MPEYALTLVSWQSMMVSATTAALARFVLRMVMAARAVRVVIVVACVGSWFEHHHVRIWST
jgi:hypothetical protein